MSSAAQNVPHRCLDIPEVVDLVFSFVKIDYREKLAASSLAILARTCKQFHDPAVKHLWRDLPGLHPIRSLFLPGSFRNESSNGNSLWFTTLTLLDDFQGFRRLGKYGPHVRSITPSAGYLPMAIDFHYYALQQIYEHPDCPRPVFPNIYEVELLDIPDLALECIFYAPLVMSASIRSITITTSDGEYLPNAIPLESVLSDARWDALAGRVADAAPRLEKFTLDSNLHHLLGRVPALSSSFTKFSKSLTNLSIGALTMDKPTLRLLGQLSSLRTLVISLFEMHIMDIESMEAMELPCLESLELKSTSMPACISFLTQYTTENLARLVVDIDFNVNQDVGPLIASLGIQALSRNLEEINIRKADFSQSGALHWDQIPHEPCFIVSPAALRTLASFTKISRLDVGPCTELEITDEDLATLFGACPLLKTFSLRGQSAEATKPKLTLKGVHDALKMTPLLDLLTISVDCTTIPPNDEPVSPHKSLAVWNVQTSPLGSGIEFGSWIDQNYPGLVLIEFFSIYHLGLRFAYLWGQDDERDIVDEYKDTAVIYARWLDVQAHLSSKAQKRGRIQDS